MAYGWSAGLPTQLDTAVTNGRRWIIRRRAEIIGPDAPPTRAEALEIEQALRALNGSVTKGAG